MNASVLKFKSPLASSQPGEIWAVGGGKGGIGKSFVSSSIAICLARMGKSVILVDLDLGSANLHTCLGTKIPPMGLSDFLSGRASEITQIISDTDIPNLRFISGVNDAFNIANIGVAERQKLLKALCGMTASYIIFDLGAGTTETTLDFFLSAEKQIVAVTPEPTSIENAYRFLKSAYYRKLRSIETELGVQSLIETAMDAKNQLGIRSPSDLLNHIRKLDAEKGAVLAGRLSEFSPQILINQVRTRNDVDLGHSMKSVCSKYFGVETNFLGAIDHDNAVWQALRKRRPLIIEHPYSSIVGQILNITKNLINRQPYKAVV